MKDFATQDAEATSSSRESQGEPRMETTVDQRSLKRRIDLHVLPMLFLIYFAAFLDRSALIAVVQNRD
ncbi:MAG: hypothetical protein Q9165_007769 [Trypethelium subeluteriae]